MQALLVIAAVVAGALAQQDPNRPVLIRVPPSPLGKDLMKVIFYSEPISKPRVQNSIPHAVPPPRAVAAPTNAPPKQVEPKIEHNEALPPSPPGALQPQFQPGPPGSQAFSPRQQVF